MSAQNNRLGIWLMIATMLIFAIQDAMSQHLARSYNVFMVVMIRYWFLAAFVVTLAIRKSGGLRAAASTSQPVLQILRGTILAVEICVMTTAFVFLGLVESHVVFASFPLLIAAMSGPVLGEKVGWRRWIAIAIGFTGIVVILQPGRTVFSAYALIPLFSAFLFAVYGLLTRYASRADSTETSFFWMGITGAVVTTLVGLWYWQPMNIGDWGWMISLCLTGALAHWCLIRCYELAEVSVVQPFAYLQLVYASIIGIMIFGEDLHLNVVIGGVIVIGAGLFTLARERQTAP